MPVTQLSSGFSPGMSSVEKKRARDRRAQQTLRDKRTSRIRNLQEQVRICQETHCSKYVENLIKTCRRLRMENELLRGLREDLQALLNSWEVVEAREPTAGQMAVQSSPGRQPEQVQNAAWALPYDFDLTPGSSMHAQRHTCDVSSSVTTTHPRASTETSRLEIHGHMTHPCWDQDMLLEVPQAVEFSS